MVTAAAGGASWGGRQSPGCAMHRPLLASIRTVTINSKEGGLASPENRTGNQTAFPNNSSKNFQHKRQRKGMEFEGPQKEQEKQERMLLGMIKTGGTLTMVQGGR